MGKRLRIETPYENMKPIVANDAETKKNGSSVTATEETKKKEVVITYALVNAAAVNVRQQPSTESLSIDILKKDEKVQLGPTKGEFTFIFYGHDYHKAGYMMSKYLKVIE